MSALPAQPLGILEVVADEGAAVVELTQRPAVPNPEGGLSVVIETRVLATYVFPPRE